MPPPPAARRVLLAPPVNHHTPVAVHNSSHPAPSSRGAPPTACRDDSTLQSLHNAVTAPCSRHQHQNTALRRAAAFLSAAALLALAIPHQRGRPPPSAAKRPNPVPFSYPGVNQETTAAPRPPVNHHQPSSSRETRNAAKRPTLYPPPPRHPFLLPPGKPPRPRPVFPGLRPSARSNANHRPRSPSHPPHPAKSPTFRLPNKSESRKVDKLANTPPPAAGPGRGEQRSTPPHPTPPSSTGTHRVTFTLHHTYPFPSLPFSYPAGRPRNHLLHPAPCILRPPLSLPPVDHHPAAGEHPP